MTGPMRTPQRIWRTDDGDLVLEGDVRAAVLAYGAQDDVENRDADAVAKLLAGDDAEPEPAKRAPAPRNKKAPAPRDK